jgi:hypothetical protein
VSAGFAMTAEGDIDLNTLVDGADDAVLAAAITVALQTFIGDWRGNLRVGIDRGLFTLREREDIEAGLRDSCTNALRGLPVRIEKCTVTEDDNRVWKVSITAINLETGNPITLTADLL